MRCGRWFVILMPVYLASLVPIINTLMTFFTAVQHRVHTPASSIVLITGAGSGVGFALAEELVNRGYTVLAGIRREQQLRELQEKAKQRENWERLIPIILDVTNSNHVDKVSLFHPFWYLAFLAK